MKFRTLQDKRKIRCHLELKMLDDVNKMYTYVYDASRNECLGENEMTRVPCVVCTTFDDGTYKWDEQRKGQGRRINYLTDFMLQFNRWDIIFSTRLLAWPSVEKSALHKHRSVRVGLTSIGADFSRRKCSVRRKPKRTRESSTNRWTSAGGRRVGWIR